MQTIYNHHGIISDNAVLENPVAFYSLARVVAKISFGKENLELSNAMAFYEPMVLNTRPSRFEDRLRKIISRKIRRRI